MNDPNPSAYFAQLFEVPSLVAGLSTQITLAFQALEMKIVSLESTVKSLQEHIPPTLMRRTAAAKYLNVSVRTVDRMIKEGAMPVVKSGKTVLCDVTKMRPVDLKKVTDRVVLGLDDDPGMGGS